MPLDIQHVSLAQLFSHAEPFHMARYQRHYEWGRKEMEQLLDDLGEAFAAHVEAPKSGAYHFLGNVILFANSSGHLEVVDGQQRLTSLTLLLIAGIGAGLEAALRDQLAGMLFVRAATGPAQPRLVLHRGDQHFLHQTLLADTTVKALEQLGRQDNQGAECLRANALIAYNWLASRPRADLTPFLRFVLAQGRFVELQVGHEDDAFRIFETVNNRGRAIASEDVLRYALVEYATPDPARREEYLARWDAMESELGPRGTKRFINGWRARLTEGGRPRQLRIWLGLLRLPCRLIV